MSVQQTESFSEKKSTKINFYLILVISMAFFLPLLSILYSSIIEKEKFTWQLAEKWFVFWAVGIRLFTAGIKQVSTPEFTAKEIFKFKTTESYVVIRELGFANIALGVLGILSVINDGWRTIAALTAGIFYGFAALQHYFKKPDSKNEWIALVSDSFIFFMLLLFIILSVLS